MKRNTYSKITTPNNEWYGVIYTDGKTRAILLFFIKKMLFPYEHNKSNHPSQPQRFIFILVAILVVAVVLKLLLLLVLQQLTQYPVHNKTRWLALNKNKTYKICTFFSNKYVHVCVFEIMKT